MKKWMNGCFQHYLCFKTNRLVFRWLCHVVMLFLLSTVFVLKVLSHLNYDMCLHMMVIVGQYGIS